VPTAASLAALSAPRALVFDLDGTLVDTVQARIDGWLATFEEVNVPADRQHVAGMIGSDGKRLAREVATLAGRELDDDAAERIDALAGEHYDRLNTSPQPLPGAAALLAALSGGAVRWAIATSSRPAQVRASLATLGLAEPPLLVDGSHVARAKPAPDLLLAAAERCGVPPGECWYVGDATWDMLAADAAGMVAVGVTAGGAVDAHALGDAGADVAIGTLAELHAELARRGLLAA
jgi:HAD superfamily hydrolase (TIGR01509 family)